VITLSEQDEDEFERYCQENESEELSDRYGKRASLPDSEWIKIEKPEDIFDLVMEHKKKHGWKFKDEN
jgi:hypothetical protein